VVECLFVFVFDYVHIMQHMDPTLLRQSA
jgi:hypothetical protein